MRDFRNILYVSRGLESEQSALSQAITLANNNQAQLTIAILYPILPKRLIDYKESYKQAVVQTVQKMANAIINTLGISQQQFESFVKIETESINRRKVWIVQQVLRHDYDLVLKLAEVHENHGFKSVDMGLMRKCPCPVWLYHPQQDNRKIQHVTVAIDPDVEHEVDIDLALRLLTLSVGIAEVLAAKLSIISCWDCAFEEIPGDEYFQGVPEREVKLIIQEERQRHLILLENLIAKAEIKYVYTVEHLRGDPAKIIPAFTIDHKADLLVMGTVARAGIQGLFIGNTAENILQKVNCSLVALKPNGFISPIKAY